MHKLVTQEPLNAFIVWNILIARFHRCEVQPNVIVRDGRRERRPIIIEIVCIDNNLLARRVVENTTQTFKSRLGRPEDVRNDVTVPLMINHAKVSTLALPPINGRRKAIRRNEEK
jgi:hypothetical protein